MHCPFLPSSWPLPSPERTPSRATGLETPVRPNPLAVVLRSSQARPRTSREVGLRVEKQPPSFLVPRVTPWHLWESSATWPLSGYPALRASWEAPWVRCHTERLTLIRMRDAWRAVGAAGVGAGTPRKPDPSRDDRALAGAGPVTEILSCIGEGEGEGEGGTGVTVRTGHRTGDRLSPP